MHSTSITGVSSVLFSSCLRLGLYSHRAIYSSDFSRQAYKAMLIEYNSAIFFHSYLTMSIDYDPVSWDRIPLFVRSMSLCVLLQVKSSETRDIC
jgi:hypothetical protein